MLAMRNEKMKMNEIFSSVSETACSVCNSIQSIDSQYSRLSSLIILYCLSRLQHNRQ